MQVGTARPSAGFSGRNAKPVHGRTSADRVAKSTESNDVFSDGRRGYFK
jgi:hypothetical protein